MIEKCNIPIIISGRRTNTDLKFKFVLANPMTGKVKKSVFHPSSHSINKYFVV